MVGLAVYVLAVFHRSSLGVAGLLAQDRFHINAVQLSLFTVLQLVVYAGPADPDRAGCCSTGSAREPCCSPDWC